MSWAVGYDHTLERWIGYGVPALCDHPDCVEEIDRGLSYVCGGEPYGGEHGCGLCFCSSHRGAVERAIPLPDDDDDEGRRLYELCERCATHQERFEGKAEHPRWLRHLATHESWAEWRDEHPLEAADARRRVQEYEAANGPLADETEEEAL